MLKSILIFIIAATIFSSTNANAGEIHNLRGQRYCEVLIARSLLSQNIQVYNTIGLNQCPQPLWSKLTIESIKQETGARFVHLNGPRYWMIDGMQNSELISTQIKNFGDISMREAGVLHLGLKDRLTGDTPYHKHEIHRTTTWVYQAGKPIYELIDPQGQVFVMQSFSTQKIPQTAQSLNSLAQKLNLPIGWKFRTRILKEPLYLPSRDKIAVVMQDEFLNTYQLETTP